jgi:hypothetical protein
MPDPGTIQHVAHHVHHVAAIQPIIHTGVSMLTTVISSAVSFLVGGGLGWYIKGRGMAGVKIDLNNVKTDVENLKTQIATKVSAAPALV